MENQVTEVKERNDIVEIISTYLTLKKAGANFKANCPFHNEKTPSFMISPERQTFKCFGCGEGGDVITFVEKMEGLDFYNALKLLAERAGITLKSNSIRYNNSEHSADKKTRIFEINDWAAKVYAKLLLTHPKAEKARQYLKDRGLSQATIEKFEIGYAPNSWDFLLRFLASKGYTDKEAVEAGVAVSSERGKIYDRFRGRIIFPINSPMGATIAFTSRILEDDGNGGAKYINSAESPIYIKGKTIYGLDKAKMAIKEADLAIMVEGNMDVIACHQAGFANVVATSGTALTLDQLKILSRYAAEIAFCFDSDNAGQTAMKRAVRMALANDISVKIISTEPYKDPDEAIKTDPKNWVKAVESAKPALEYWINLLLEKTEKLDVSAKKKIAKEILPVIKNTFSEIEKESYIKYLAQKLNVSEKSLVEALDKTKQDREFAKNEENITTKKEKLTIEEKIIGLVWSNLDLVNKVNLEFEITDARFKDFWQMIRDKNISKEKISSSDAIMFNNLALLSLENINESDEENVLQELNYLIGRLRSERRDETKEQYARKIEAAERAGDKELVKKLLKEFSGLIK